MENKRNQGREGVQDPAPCTPQSLIQILHLLVFTLREEKQRMRVLRAVEVIYLLRIKA